MLQTALCCHCIEGGELAIQFEAGTAIGIRIGNVGFENGLLCLRGIVCSNASRKKIMNYVEL